MIFDITYTQKEVDDAIDDLVGAPFNFIERLKLGGIGSERVMIKETSEDLGHYLQYVDAPNFCNFELRPTGVIIHINYRTQDIAWVVPYRKLSIYRSGHGVKLYCDTSFLQIEKVYKGSNIKQFIEKLMRLRALYLDQIRPPF